MTERQYNKKMESFKIINDFKRLYYEKIGIKPIVTIYEDLPTVRILKQAKQKILGLEVIEDVINTFIPAYFIQVLKIKNIKHKTRKKDIAELRHIFSYIAKNMGYTLKTIGYYLGDKDHSTVLNSLKKFNNYVITNDEEFLDKYNEIMIKINECIDGNKLLQPVDEESADTESTLSSVLL